MLAPDIIPDGVKTPTINGCIPPSHGIFRIIWAYALTPGERYALQLSNPFGPSTFDVTEEIPPLADVIIGCWFQSWVAEVVPVVQLAADSGADPIPISGATANWMKAQPELRQSLEYCACSYEIGLSWLLAAHLDYDADATTTALAMVMNTINEHEYEKIRDTPNRHSRYSKELNPWFDIGDSVPDYVLNRASRNGNVLIVKRVLREEVGPQAVVDALSNARARRFHNIVRLLVEYQKRR